MCSITSIRLHALKRALFGSLWIRRYSTTTTIYHRNMAEYTVPSGHVRRAVYLLPYCFIDFCELCSFMVESDVQNKCSLVLQLFEISHYLMHISLQFFVCPHPQIFFFVAVAARQALFRRHLTSLQPRNPAGIVHSWSLSARIGPVSLCPWQMQNLRFWKGLQRQVCS